MHVHVEGVGGDLKKAHADRMTVLGAVLAEGAIKRLLQGARLDGPPVDEPMLKLPRANQTVGRADVELRAKSRALRFDGQQVLGVELAQDRAQARRLFLGIEAQMQAALGLIKELDLGVRESRFL